jgi:hypothetical protein
MGRKLIGLTLVTLRGSLGKLRQHIRRQKVQRFTNVLVPIPPGLLQQDDLIDAGVLEVLDVSAEISGRADAGRSLEGARQAFRRRRGRIEDAALLLLELLEQAGAAGHCIVGNKGRYGKRKNSKPSIPRPTASSRSACSENADTIAISALTLCPSGTHASLLMVS